MRPGRLGPEVRRLAAAGLLALTLAAMLQPGAALPLSTVPLRHHNPAVIDGDRDWCDRVNAQGLDDDGVRCDGADGSPGAPFVIEGWVFNLAAYPEGTAGLTIRNTTKSWVVRNNVFIDSRAERVRDGLVLRGASDDRGAVEQNRFEDLRSGLVAREWLDSALCTTADGTVRTCMWRRISAPDVLGNAFRRVEEAVVNGPNLPLPGTGTSGAFARNNLEQTGNWAYVEVRPTAWQPSLAQNWWGSAAGPTLEQQPSDGPLGPGGRVRAQCTASQLLPTGQPRCVTPWLPAPNPAAGPLNVWG